MRQTIAIILLIIVLSGCNSLTGDSEKEQITVSIWPQKYFLEKLVGDDFQINVMIPESNSPAVYEPTPQQIKSLSNSVFYFANGELGFEKAWMQKLKSGNPDMIVVNTSKGISLIHESDHGHQGADPHYWLSPGACFQMVINMKEELAKAYPEKSTVYEKKLSEIQKEIAEIDFLIRDMLAGLQKRQFLIYHPSLSYYARDYNLEQLAIEIHGKEPSLVYIQETIKRASKKGLKNVFVQQQFNTESAETIAKELGGQVILFNPLSYNWDQEIISLTRKMIENASD